MLAPQRVDGTGRLDHRTPSRGNGHQPFPLHCSTEKNIEADIGFLGRNLRSILADPLLQRCRERAAGYDRDNLFCKEDFDELKAAGYLRMALPTEFGGVGLTLGEAGRETRRLANHAPATAICINMHQYWVGTAADVWRSGDKSVEWMLQDAADGHVFAAGHAESGNETSLFSSTTRAERRPPRNGFE